MALKGRHGLKQGAVGFDGVDVGMNKRKIWQVAFVYWHTEEN